MENASCIRNYPDLLSDLLRRHVGRGHPISIEQLAKAAGCSAKTIYMIRADEFTPSFDLGLRIVKCLPDEAVTEFFAGLGFHGLTRLEGVGSLHEVHYELTRTGAYYGEAYRDGLIDHREARDLATKFLPRLAAAAARCMRPVKRI